MRDMSASLVTVVIPTYNVGAFVRDAVESVLSQTHGALEAIVVDDGSTDGTLTHLDALAGAGRDDPRLTVLTKDNGGVSTARNLGIERARGEFIAFLDADDVWDVDKLERTLPALASPGTVAAGTMMRYIDESGRDLGSAAGEDPTVGDAPERIRAARLMPFPLSGIVFRADAVAQAGPYDPGLRLAQDLDFLARIARLGDLGYVSHPTGGYRLRATAASARSYARQRKHMRFIQERLARRDAGGDLGWDEFDAAYAPSWRTRRRDYAAAAYRDGGLALAQGRRAGALQVMGALAVDPSYAVPRLVRHVRARRA